MHKTDLESRVLTLAFNKKCL